MKSPPTIKSRKQLIDHLKKEGHKKIYLSHQPWQEEEARELAQKLTGEGFNVIVGADARPHKDNPRDDKDLETVRKIIVSCDVVIVYAKFEEVGG